MTNRTLRNQILDALTVQSVGNIQKAEANVEIYLANPVGIGEHPDVLAAIQTQLDIIAEETERISVLEEHFKNRTDD